MRCLLLCLLFLILVGAGGMAIGNKKVDVKVRQQRWQKFASYLLITAAVIVSILYRFFFGMTIVIVLFGYYELLRTAGRTKRRGVATLIIYTILSLGFLFFGFNVSREYQFFFYFLVLIFDAFCQITGQIFGKTPMMPNISPAKTWEGLIGGTLFCVASSILCAGWLGLNIFLPVVLALATSLTSLAGDLLASYYKRIAGIKDYSNFLPGQGGFLDRFDSLIMTGFSVTIFILAKFFLTGSFHAW